MNRHKNSKVHIVKENQKNLVRPVEYTENIRENLKKGFSKDNIVTKKGVGIQVENIIHLTNGDTKFVNRKTIKVNEVDISKHSELKPLLQKIKSKRGNKKWAT